MRYFPVETPHQMKMGTGPLGDAPIIEIDPDHYRAEMALKEAILAEDHRYYCQTPPDTEAAGWEVVDLLTRAIAHDYPADFALGIDGDDRIWHNRLLGTETRYRHGDAATLPYAPLDWIGRQVQEDLIVMGPDPERGFPLIAGQLCFASGWDLDEMMGRSFLSIHEDVNLFADTIGRSANLLMERLKVERPVWRANWSVKTLPLLNSAPRFRHLYLGTKDGITPDNAGERCWLRVERQVLLRLPLTRAVLFTIHTYQTPLHELAADPERSRRLAAAIRSMPGGIFAYKGLAPYVEPLLAYLDTRGAG